MDQSEGKQTPPGADFHRYSTMVVAPSSRKEDLRCYAEVDLSRLSKNIKTVQECAASTGCKLMGVVKADAYGMGAVQVAQELQSCGVDFVAVATLSEAIELRLKGIERNMHILVLGAPMKSELEGYANHRLDVMVSSPEVADEVIEFGQNQRNGLLRVHTMIETGMSRMGLVEDQAVDVIGKLVAARNVEYVGFCTHMADARVGSKYPQEQVDRFVKILRMVLAHGIHPPLIHFENSDSIMYDLLPDSFVKDLLEEAGSKGYIRCGYALLGYDCQSQLGPEIRMVTSVYAQVRHVHVVKKGTTVGYGRNWEAPEDSLIATIAVGYADGYPRALGNVGEVRIGEHLYKIAGTICMDMTMINLGDPDGHGKDVKIGEYAVLYGARADHPKNPYVGDVAQLAKLDEVELTCYMSKRVPRIHDRK